MPVIGEVRHRRTSRTGSRLVCGRGTRLRVRANPPPAGGGGRGHRPPKKGCVPKIDLKFPAFFLPEEGFSDVVGGGGRPGLASPPRRAGAGSFSNSSVGSAGFYDITRRTAKTKYPQYESFWYPICIFPVPMYQPSECRWLIVKGRRSCVPEPNPFCHGFGAKKNGPLSTWGVLQFSSRHQPPRRGRGGPGGGGGGQSKNFLHLGAFLNSPFILSILNTINQLL